VNVRVQIQILLLMYKLSLPGPIPPPTVPPGKKKKKRRLEIEMEVDPDPTAEDYLESYMDKLSTWQLVGALDRPKSNPSADKQTGNPKSKTDDRDWIQMFAEDIVDREYVSGFSCFP